MIRPSIVIDANAPFWAQRLAVDLQNALTSLANGIGPSTILKANLPTNGTERIAIVPDEAGGTVLAFFDGTDWRRVTDRAVVS
jgi:hypothetical protein